MSTNLKKIKWLFSLLLIGNILSAQTLELSTRQYSRLPLAQPTVGPVTSLLGPIDMDYDNTENNQFANPTPALATSVSFALANQQFAPGNVPPKYTMNNYSNISTGLVFGAQPTTAFDGAALPQRVDPLNNYSLLGSYNAAVGGPTNAMFTAKGGGAAGTGVICDGFHSAPANGSNNAVSVFTATQALFDQPGSPLPNGTANRFYMGDVVITFSRFIADPVIHLAGLGGSYRYNPASAPTTWKSTYFSTELELPNGTILDNLSGNQFFQVAGNKILNNAVTPNGASVSSPNGIFNDLGAATGSVRARGTFKTLVIKVFVRGSDASEFSWSEIQANIAQPNNRNPFTGDIWYISTSFGTPQLIPLPSTGLYLQGALNGSDVKLNWKTQTEINSKNFVIERSADGTNFTEIGIKDAAGNSTTEKNYDYLDRNMATSIYYYRLKMIDVDDRYGYSNIVAIRKAGGIKDIRVYPNPATDNVSLEFSNAKGNYSIRLFNQAGQEVMSNVATVQYEVQTIGIQRNNLPAGYYMIQIRNNNDGSVRSEKVIFQ